MASRAEQETIIRWDEDEQVAWVFTSCERIMKRYTKLGWHFAVTSICKGEPNGWTARGPAKYVKLRRLVNGVTPKRVATGRPFQSAKSATPRT